jgi:glycosyltransferase involved in cell wall biosynthesis
MKKICYIGYETFFGPDKAIMSLLSSEYQITFHCIQSADAWISQEEIKKVSETPGITAVPLMHKARRRSIRQFFYNYRLLSKVRSQDYDFIFIVPEHNIYLALLAPLLLKKNKTIIAFHDVVPHLNDTNFLKNLSLDLYKVFFRNFHFFSKTQMNIFKASHPGKNCSYSSLNFGETMSELFAGDSKSAVTHFLFFGGIKYYKGLDILILACEQLAREGITNFKLTIAGSGDYWEHCKELIKTPALYNLAVRFLEESEIPGLFAEADFLVLPYRDVTQSGPLALSHQYNLPAIGSAHDGFKEHIEHGKNGYLFENEDVRDLKEVLKTAVYLSRDQYASIKENLLDYTTALYDPQQTLQTFSDAFEGLK